MEGIALLNNANGLNNRFGVGVILYYIRYYKRNHMLILTQK